MLAIASGPHPHVRTRSKTRASAGDEARAVAKAAVAWRNSPLWMPVVWGGGVVAYVRGADRRGVEIRCSAPFADYDQAALALTSQQRGGSYFMKVSASSLVTKNWYDLWGVDANPAAGNWSGTALTARQFTTGTTGGLQVGPPVAPRTKYATRTSLMANNAQYCALLYDRVLSYDACLMSAASQNFVNTLAATRYISGGPGLQVFVEADSVHSATAANLTTLTYVNNLGNAGHVVETTPTLALIPSVAAPTKEIGARGVIQAPGLATGAPCAPYLQLQAGDLGVTSLTNVQFSAAPTGTNSFTLQFPFALFPDHALTESPSDYEFVSGLESVNKQIYDDACLAWLIYPISTTATPIHGWIEYGWH